MENFGNRDESTHDDAENPSEMLIETAREPLREAFDDDLPNMSKRLRLDGGKMTFGQKVMNGLNNLKTKPQVRSV